MLRFTRWQFGNVTYCADRSQRIRIVYESDKLKLEGQLGAGERIQDRSEHVANIGLSVDSDRRRERDELQQYGLERGGYVLLPCFCVQRIGEFRILECSKRNHELDSSGTDRSQRFRIVYESNKIELEGQLGAGERIQDRAEREFRQLRVRRSRELGRERD
jgi:hypothetical protein